MVDDNVSGAGETGSGAPNDESQSGANGEGQNLVPKSELDRALADMHKFKQRARDSEDKLNSLQQTVEELKARGLKEKEDYKALYEDAKSKLEEEQRTSSKLKSNVIFSERYRAVLPALQKAGLSPDAAKLVEHADMSELEVEAQNGRFVVNGVDLFVEKFKLEYPFAFKPASAANVNSGGTNPPATRGNAPITAKDLYKVEVECRKKGDMQPYRDALAKYVQQQRA
jgi:hypothetical protein